MDKKMTEEEVIIISMLLNKMIGIRRLDPETELFMLQQTLRKEVLTYGN